MRISPDLTNTFPIFGVLYSIEEYVGLIPGDDGKTCLTYHDAAAHKILVSTAIPAPHRDQCIAIVVAQVAEYLAARQ